MSTTNILLMVAIVMICLFAIGHAFYKEFTEKSIGSFSGGSNSSSSRHDSFSSSGSFSSSHSSFSGGSGSFGGGGSSWGVVILPRVCLKEILTFFLLPA
jgi:uncharacterized protein